MRFWTVWMSKDMTKVLDSGVGKYVWRREYMMEEQGEREREGGREGGGGICWNKGSLLV